MQFLNPWNTIARWSGLFGSKLLGMYTHAFFRTASLPESRWSLSARPVGAGASSGAVGDTASEGVADEAAACAVATRKIVASARCSPTSTATSDAPAHIPASVGRETDTID